MAQRTLKIALSSSVADPAAVATIWLDNQVIQSNLSITNNINSPYVVEHTFEATGLHQLKISMVNDFLDQTKDLNLNVNYVALSNEDGTYPAYTYLATSTDVNYRTTDYSSILTDTIWEAGKSFDLSFDTNALVTWYDMYQYDIDNLPPNV
jgi:uncharacterized protein Usg